MSNCSPRINGNILNIAANMRVKTANGRQSARIKSASLKRVALRSGIQARLESLIASRLASWSSDDAKWTYDR